MVRPVDTRNANSLRLATNGGLVKVATATGPAGPNTVPTDEAIAAAVANPASDTAAALSDAIGANADVARFQSIPRAAGVVCFTWDDGFDEWADILTAAIARGQHHTFCVTKTSVVGFGGTLPTSFLSAAVAANQEIAAHSVDHSKMTSLTAAQRATQYDDTKTFLEGYTGAGTVTTWAYPFGTQSAPPGRDTTTDRELFLRYDRLLDTSVSGTVVPDGPRRFLVPRLTWSPGDAASQAKVLAAIRHAATHRVIVTIYAHEADTVGKLDDVIEAMDLAQSLGIPCITSREAFPAYPYGFLDSGFESANAIGIWAAGGNITPATATVTPPTGYGGTKALYLTTPTTGDTCFVSQYPQGGIVPGRTYRFSGSYKVSASVSAPSKCYVQADWVDINGTPITTDYGASLTSSTDSTFSSAWTAPAAAHDVQAKIVLTGVTLGEAWFYRVDWAEDTYGLPAYG